MFVAGLAPSDSTSGLPGVPVDNGRRRPPGQMAVQWRRLSSLGSQTRFLRRSHCDKGGGRESHGRIL
jgi:hypothetical protein